MFLQAAILIVWLIGCIVTGAILDKRKIGQKYSNTEEDIIINIGIVVYSICFWPLRLLIIGIKHYAD